MKQVCVCTRDIIAKECDFLVKVVTHHTPYKCIKCPIYRVTECGSSHSSKVCLNAHRYLLQDYSSTVMDFNY